MNYLSGDTKRVIARADVGLLAAAAAPLITATIWAIVGVRQYSRFESGIDLTIFSQAAQSMSQGNLPRSSVKGEDYILWGDHFHPLIVVLAPVYRLWPTPASLLVVQAIAIGLCCAITCHTSYEVLRHRLSAGRGKALTGGVVCALLLGFSPGMEGGAFFDFHEVSLGLPFLALACRGFILKRSRSLVIWSIAFLLTKEDAGLIVAGLGLSAVVVGRRLMGSLLVGAGVAWTGLCMRVIIPAFARGPWAYQGKLPSDLDSLVGNLTFNVISPGGLTVMLLVLTVRTGIVAPLSPLFLSVIPNLASRAVTRQTEYSSIAYHYNMTLAVLLISAVIDAFHRVKVPWRKVLAALVIASLVITVSVARFPRALVGRPSLARADAARCAVDAVPKGEGVVAEAYLTPQLTLEHEPVRELHPRIDPAQPGGPAFPNVAWMIVDSQTINYSSSPGWAEGVKVSALRAGWQTVKVCDSFTVLTR